MIKREELMVGLAVITIKEQTLISKTDYKSKSFPVGTILKIKRIPKNKSEMSLELEDKSLWRFPNLKEALENINEYSKASDKDQQKHGEKKVKEDFIKKIKKLSEKDNLKEIEELVSKNESFFKEKSTVKKIMAALIRNESIKTLSYGFENHWFKKIDWNENIISGSITGTPLGYAVQLNEEENSEVIKTLILHGASLENKCWGNQSETINEVIEDGYVYAEISVEKIEEYQKLREKVELKQKLDTTLEETILVSKKNKL